MKRSASIHRRSLPQLLLPPRTLAVALAALCCLVLLSSCGLHSGTDQIAFIEGNQLWTIQSDGSSPNAVSQRGVLDFAWSPDHHQIVFRYTSGQTSPATSPDTSSMPDAPADLAIQSVNGGYALQITPSQPGELRSAAWWDASGNRLMYRETAGTGGPPLYVVSQADQPVGIGRKILLDAASIPAVSPDGKQIAVLDPSGAVRVGAPGAIGDIVATGALLTFPGPDGNRPARVLWQPQHDALLYATTSATGIAFTLRDLHGGARTIATTATALDAAFSPDGALLLVRTPSSFELWNAAGSSAPLFSWPETDPLALPWWSPDGRALLIQDAAGWSLVHVAAKTVSSLVAFPSGSISNATPPSSATWTPATADPWSPDGSQIVFAAPSGSRGYGAPLAPPKHANTGLYVASLKGSGLDTASLIYSGPLRSPGWGYAAPNTVFLIPANGP